MDKKDLENLSVSELLKLKESINDEIEKSVPNRHFLVLIEKDYL